MPCIISMTKVLILGYPEIVFTTCLIFLYTVTTWLHVLKSRRRNQLNGRGQCVASCGVWQAFAVSWLCALPIYKKPPRRRQAAGHREIVARKGSNKKTQEFPSFAQKPREVLPVDRGFLWVWFQVAQFFASTPVDIPEFRIHVETVLVQRLWIMLNLKKRDDTCPGPSSLVAE